MTVTNLNYGPDDPGVARVTDTSGTIARPWAHVDTRARWRHCPPDGGNVCVISRAANHPSVFTIMEKIPTSAFTIKTIC